ncbi:MAG: hypothetical protein WA580_09485 [Acidimicrobiales bacterium]
MIATSVAYDIVFLAHILAAVATIVVFITMRLAALSVVRGADATTQALRFPAHRNWAARLMHLLPITGLIMVASGGSSVSVTRAWVIVGLVCYLAAAGHLEARTLPEERLVASAVARDGVAPREVGLKLLRSIDTLLAIIAVAFVTMLIQY